MTLQKFDYIFPFIVFSYGIFMIFVLENKTLDKLAEQKIPELFQILRGHRSLAWLCFFVGGFWSLQNLFLFEF